MVNAEQGAKRPTDFGVGSRGAVDGHDIDDSSFRDPQIIRATCRLLARARPPAATAQFSAAAKSILQIISQTDKKRLSKAKLVAYFTMQR